MNLQFPVSPEKNKSLQEKMKLLGISESDLIETFTKSGGNGGQNVNKLSTTVHLKYPKEDLEIKCNIYRTQGLNRYKARAILCEKLENKRTPNPLREKIIRNKIKKRNKRRKKDLDRFNELE